MDLKQLKTFICVAECGSLSRASDRLHIVQPALSRHIKLLEHEVGVPLFTRHVRGMALTEEGQLFLERVAGLVRQLETSVHDVRSIKTEIKGHVALGLTPTTNAVLGVRLLERVWQQAEAINLRIVEGSSVHLLEWLQRGDIDKAVLYQGSSDLHLHTVELLREELVLASPPASIRNKKKTILLEEVAALPLAFTSQPDMYSVLIDKAMKKAGVAPSRVYEVGSFWIMRKLVISGFCHSIIPVSAIHSDVRKGTIESRTIRPGSLYRDIALGSPNDRTDTRAAELVARILMEEVLGMVIDGSWPARACDELKAIAS